MKKLMFLALLLGTLQANASTITVTFQDYSVPSNPCLGQTFACTSSGYDFFTIGGTQSVDVVDLAGNHALEVGTEFYVASFSMQPASGSPINTFSVLSYDVRRMTPELLIDGVDAPLGLWHTVNIDNPTVGNSFSVSASNSGGTGGFLYIDNIVVSTVPIPAAVWLFASSLGLLGWFRQKSI